MADRQPRGLGLHFAMSIAERLAEDGTEVRQLLASKRAATSDLTEEYSRKQV